MRRWRHLSIVKRPNEGAEYLETLPDLRAFAYLIAWGPGALSVDKLIEITWLRWRGASDTLH